jgi:hypothetical protein
MIDLRPQDGPSQKTLQKAIKTGRDKNSYHKEKELRSVPGEKVLPERWHPFLPEMAEFMYERSTETLTSLDLNWIFCVGRAQRKFKAKVIGGTVLN